jgi:hypothetical protein
MNEIRLIQSSFRNLARFKLRSFFMSIGVAVGVATLIAGNSLGGGAAQKISDPTGPAGRCGADGPSRCVCTAPHDG